jgi:hypothetical protein
MNGLTQRGILQKDDNDYPSMGGTSYIDNETIINSAYDPVTRRLLVDLSGGGGTSLVVGTTTVTGGTSGYVLYDNGGVLGEKLAGGMGMEIPVGTVDGVNTVFTVQNTPLYEEVSGQVMVSSTQDPTNYGYDYSSGTITFVNPPTQTPHSFYNVTSPITPGSSGFDISSADTSGFDS